MGHNYFFDQLFFCKNDDDVCNETSLLHNKLFKWFRDVGKCIMNVMKNELVVVESPELIGFPEAALSQCYQHEDDNIES